MTKLVPFNRNRNLTRTSNFDNFYNMLDDFFTDSFPTSRNLLRDTFKIDIQEKDNEYLIEAELPGIKKENIELAIEDDNICISVNSEEEVNEEGTNYIHRERRYGSMARRIRLANANLAESQAKLDEGILKITIPKQEKASGAQKIDID